MHSYFDVNTQRAEAFASIPQSEKGSLICFMTIADFVNLLYDNNTNLAFGITGDFMNDIMRVDFNKIINGLRSFAGVDRRGIREAQSSLNDALHNLYKAMEANQKGNSDKKVKALLDCRNKLEAAYYSLEHLGKSR